MLGEVDGGEGGEGGHDDDGGRPGCVPVAVWMMRRREGSE